jgi:hypothetical protein
MYYPLVLITVLSIPPLSSQYMHAKYFRVDVEVEIIPKSLGDVPGENKNAEPFPAKKLDWLVGSLKRKSRRYTIFSQESVDWLVSGIQTLNHPSQEVLTGWLVEWVRAYEKRQSPRFDKNRRDKECDELALLLSPTNSKINL